MLLLTTLTQTEGLYENYNEMSPLKICIAIETDCAPSVLIKYVQA